MSEEKKQYTRKDFCRDLGVHESYFRHCAKTAYDLSKTGGWNCKYGVSSRRSDDLRFRNNLSKLERKLKGGKKNNE